MNLEVRSVLLGSAGLTVAAVIALLLTLSRAGVNASKAELRAAVRTALGLILIQAAHFVEEFATGFHQRFPELLSLTPWSPQFFVSFNLSWLAIWSLSIWGLAARRKSALFPLWFLDVSSAANGVAHPLFSVLTGGYFPGLVTAPFAGVTGVLLMRRLLQVTAGRDPAVAARA